MFSDTGLHTPKASNQYSLLSQDKLFTVKYWKTEKSENSKMSDNNKKMSSQVPFQNVKTK